MYILVSADTINQSIRSQTYLVDEAEIQSSFITKPLSNAGRFVRRQHPGVQVGASTLAHPVLLTSVTTTGFTAATTLGVATSTDAYGTAFVGLGAATADSAADAAAGSAVAVGGLVYVLTKPKGSNDKICDVHFECDDMGIQSSKPFSQPRRQ
jgi:hypothetical protein